MIEPHLNPDKMKHVSGLLFPELKIEKMYPDVILPSFKNEGDAGFDIRVRLPDCNPFCEKCIKIYPNQKISFGTGIKMDIPEGYNVELHIRSSVAIKHDLVLQNTVGIIDQGYKDEIIVCVRNVSKNTVYTIGHNERLVQGILRKKQYCNIIEVYSINKENDRGGGIGSTGKF